ncbi:MAG: hypothetical protein IJR80_03160 [Treponema sp.]|nr:hypothetical protein [Treponema sp.]
MAMNGDTLGLAIAAAVLDSGATAEGKAMCEDLWKKVGNAIVDHIVNNAEVPAGISVSTTGTQYAQSGSTTSAGSVI